MIKRLCCDALPLQFASRHMVMFKRPYVWEDINFLSSRFEALHIDCITHIYELVEEKYNMHLCQKFLQSYHVFHCCYKHDRLPDTHMQISWFTLFIYSVCFIPHKTLGNFSYFPRILFLNFHRITRCLDCNLKRSKRISARDVLYNKRLLI